MLSLQQTRYPMTKSLLEMKRMKKDFADEDCWGLSLGLLSLDSHSRPINSNEKMVSYEYKFQNLILWTLIWRFTKFKILINYYTTCMFILQTNALFHLIFDLLLNNLVETLLLFDLPLDDYLCWIWSDSIYIVRVCKR